MIQVISKNHGLAGGYLDATQHITSALTRLFSDKELGPIRVQMAQMADTARANQQRVSATRN